MSRCTRCKKLIPDSEAHGSLDRLRAIAHEQGKPEGELVNKLYPLCPGCLEKVAPKE